MNALPLSSNKSSRGVVPKTFRFLSVIELHDRRAAHALFPYSIRGQLYALPHVLS